MSKSQDRLISKMKKLLAMANSKNNENEAMTAARQLHSLLAKHNISMSEVERSEEDISEEFVTHKCRPWKTLVGQSIAELYFCSFYMCRIGNGKSQYFFVGSEANRAFAIHIFEMVVKTVERESRKASREHYGREVSSFVNSFWTGARIRIGERCRDLIRQGKEGLLEDEEGNNLPSLLSAYDQAKISLDAFTDSKGLTTRNARVNADNMAGVRKGKETGDRVQLSRTLQNNSSPKLLNR